MRGEVPRLRAYFVWSPAAGVPARTQPAGGLAGDRAAPGLERGREDPARRPSFAPAIVLRSSTTRPARTRTRRPSPGDRAGDRALPRARATAGTTSATTSSSTASARSSKAGTAGSSATCRRARRGVQHRLGRRRGDRRVQLTSRRREGAQRAGGAARLAPRHRARRSRRTLSFISGGNARFRPVCPSSSHRLRSPRHGLHRLPGDGALHLLTRSRGEVARSGCRSCMRPSSPARCPAWSGSGRAFVPLPVDRRRLRRGRERGRLERGARNECRLDLGRDAGPAGELLVLDPLGGQRHARGRDDRRRRRRRCRLRVTGARCGPRDGHAERRHDRRQTTITYTLNEPAQRHRDVAGRFRRAVATIADEAWKRAGEHAFRFDPASSAGRHLQSSCPQRDRRRVRRPPRRSSPSAGRSARSPPPGSPSHPTRTAWGLGSRSASSSPLRRRSGCGSSSTASGSRRRSRARSSRVRRSSTGTGPSASVGWSTANTRRSSRRPTPFATPTVAVPFAADTRAPKVRIVQRSPLRIWVSEPAR